MRAPAISLDQLASLPAVYRAVISPAYEDRNGHMNMRWYLGLYDEAGDAMYPMLGLTADYFAASGAGGFDLEHHLWYPSEVHIGDTVVIRVRILARNAKLLHYMIFTRPIALIPRDLTDGWNRGGKDEAVSFSITQPAESHLRATGAGAGLREDSGRFDEREIIENRHSWAVNPAGRVRSSSTTA